MWKAYSADFIRNNKTGNRFIMSISFLASMFLSVISGLFGNFWADQVQQAVRKSGISQVTMTPVIIAYIVVFSAASIALILMIHHAFAATMQSRIHQLGILKSIGATRRQIRKALTNEVIVLSLPAIIIGNLIGVGICWVIMKLIITATKDLRDYTLTFTYSPLVFLGSLAFSIFTSAVSARIPARKLSRITPLDAIRYGNEPVVKRVRKFRLRSAVFGIHDELARKSLFVRRKAMRIGTASVFLAVFACISLLNMLGISNLSTERTYFDRFGNNWDYLITTGADSYSRELLQEIRSTDHVASCIVHKIVQSATLIPADYLSDEVQGLGLTNLSSEFTVNEAGSYVTKVPIYILDDVSFTEYAAESPEASVIAVNIIWDSVNSERTDRQYVPFLKSGSDIALDINGAVIPVSGFAQALPVLREELDQYSLTLVMSESYYISLGFDLPAEDPTYTVKLSDESQYDMVEEKLQELLAAYPEYAFEGRVEEREDELSIQRGLRMLIYVFTGLLTCIGLANIFASTLGQIHQRKREFARYFAIGLTPKGAVRILAREALVVALRPILWTIVINIPLLALMLNAGGISAKDFFAERLPLVPAIILFTSVIGFVALAYYLGGRKICSMNLAETIKDDTLMM